MVPTDVDQLPVPSRGVRPRNRRELALVTASELFHAQGYHRVSMNDLAAQVGMGPSALYRHFAGKADMLRVVVIGSLEVLEERFETEDEDLPILIARTAVLFRRTGLIVRRERAYLDAENAAVAAGHLDRARDALCRRVEKARPELARRQVEVVAEALLAIASSRSYVPIDDAPDRAIAVVVALVERVLASDVPPVPRARNLGTGTARSRREVLLRAAIELFAKHGYANVTVNDIRARAGSATSAVYDHLGSKADALYAGCMRRLDQVTLAHQRAVSGVAVPRDQLRAALEALVRDAVENPDLAALALVESSHLDGDQARLFGAARDAYAEEWDRLIATAAPHLPAEDRRIRVAALLIAAAEVPRNLPGVDLGAALVCLGTAVLGLED